MLFHTEFECGPKVGMGGIAPVGTGLGYAHSSNSLCHILVWFPETGKFIGWIVSKPCSHLPCITLGSAGDEAGIFMFSNEKEETIEQHRDRSCLQGTLQDTGHWSVCAGALGGTRLPKA